MNILKMGIASGKLSGTGIKLSPTPKPSLKIMDGKSGIVKGRPMA